MKILILINIFYLLFVTTDVLGQEVAGSPKSVSKTLKSYSVLSYDVDKQATKNCNKFIDHKGNLGEYGNLLVEGINKAGRDCFYKQADFSKICPNYTNFSIQEKNQFLAFMFAATSAYESACTANKKAGGTYGTAVGLLQLELEYKLRKSRPSVCVPEGKKKKSRSILSYNEVTGAKYQMECSAAIFKQIYCSEPDPNPKCKVTPKRTVGTYNCGKWQKLNGSKKGGQREITRMASKFPGC